MKEQIRVALIYNSNSKFLSGTHFDNTYYNFFIKAWKRNPLLDVTYFPTDKRFDASKLKGKFDIIFLWSNNNFEMPEEIVGIHSLEIPDKFFEELDKEHDNSKLMAKRQKDLKDKHRKSQYDGQD